MRQALATLANGGATHTRSGHDRRDHRSGGCRGNNADDDHSVRGQSVLMAGAMAVAAKTRIRVGLLLPTAVLAAVAGSSLGGISLAAMAAGGY